MKLSKLKQWSHKSRKNTIPLIVAAFISLLLIEIEVLSSGWNLRWREWTGLGEDIEETVVEERSPNGTINKLTVSRKKLSGKKLWDGLSVLGVPFAITLLGFWFQQEQQKRAEQERELQQKQADDEAKEEALQVYFDRLSELLIEKNLNAVAVRVKQADASQLTLQDISEQKELLEASVDVIRARTLSILRRFSQDGPRKSSIIRFLIETEAITKLEVDLSLADLSNTNLVDTQFLKAKLNGANLSNSDLNDTNFTGAVLNDAKLNNASLVGAILSHTNLTGANLSGANLTSAVLRNADLSGANLTNAILSDADLSGANLFLAKLHGTDLSGSTIEAEQLKRVLPYETLLPSQKKGK